MMRHRGDTAKPRLPLLDWNWGRGHTLGGGGGGGIHSEGGPYTQRGGGGDTLKGNLQSSKGTAGYNILCNPIRVNSVRCC